MTAGKPPYSVPLSLPWLLLFGEDGGGDGASTVGRYGTDRFQRSGGRRGSLCEHCNYIRGKAMARKENQTVVGGSIQYVGSLGYHRQDRANLGFILPICLIQATQITCLHMLSHFALISGYVNIPTGRNFIYFSVNNLGELRMCGKGAVITRINFALHQRRLAQLALGVHFLAVELPGRQFS